MNAFALQWVQGSEPFYLVPLLLAILATVLGVAWAERPRDDIDQLLRDERRKARR